MSVTKRFDSIIFDLDGTLWDSTQNVAMAWQKAVAQVDYVPFEITRETVRSITGMAYDAIFEKLFPYLENDRRKELQSLCAAYELETLNEKGGALYDNLVETLTYLKTKYRLFIVSNCQSGYIEIFLKSPQVAPLFEGHQCYGTKGQPKYQNIQDIVASHGLNAPVYIGDTAGDRDSARKAGVPFIYAAYGFGKVDDGYVASISRFDRLNALL